MYNVNMKREIKFRAWEVKKKMMYPVLGLYCGADLKDFGYPANSFLIYSNHFGVVAYLPLNDKDRIIMQYTGLKDKNGLEIYEGDVISDDDGETHATVIFWHGCFTVDDYEHATQDGIALDDGNVSVLGNIYENPELIK